MQSLRVLYTFLFMSCLANCVFLDENGLIFVNDEANNDQLNFQQKTIKEPAEIFEATNEWQDVGDKVLPRGIHVRINLETGKKEAKLLESPDEVDVHSRITSNYQVVREDTRKTIINSVESIKKLDDLKEISKKSSLKYKSIDEIKKANVKFTTEGILLNEIIDKYSQEAEEKNRLVYLADIEYYVHSIDLAQNLFKSGGFTTLIRDLNQTESSHLKLSILAVVGAAIQGNPQLKNELSKSEFLRQIVVLMVNAKDVSILKRSLFVLGAFLRNFPQAQKNFFHLYNGVHILESLLSKDQLLAVKTSTLLSDLAIEISAATELQNEHTQIYGQIQFVPIVRESRICFQLVELVRSFSDKSSFPSLFDSMVGLVSVCAEEFQANIAFFQEINSQIQHTDHEFAMHSLEILLGKLKQKDEL